jgi:hypothetical protein
MQHKSDYVINGADWRPFSTELILVKGLTEMMTEISNRIVRLYCQATRKEKQLSGYSKIKKGSRSLCPKFSD